MTPSTQARFERKYLIPNSDPMEVAIRVKLNNAMFSTHHPSRFVNTIYLDTMDFKNYHDNLDSTTQRTKVRIRWYGALHGLVEQPTLEFKKKYGLLGDKEKYRINSFYFDESFDMKTFIYSLSHSGLPASIHHQLSSLRPTLLNRYYREYFLSFDRKIRLTIDSKMVFYRVYGTHCLSQHPMLDHHVVLELKYANHPEIDKEAMNISNQWPFRMTKHSKYVYGVGLLYDL